MNSHQANERGFTLVEVIVAILFTTIVLIAVGTTLTLSLSTERDLISRHRAQVLADQTISKIASLPRDAQGMYQDDTVETRWTPPIENCRRASGRYSPTCNENLFIHFLPGDRPTSGYVAMPPMTQTITTDDSARNGARREYTVDVMVARYTFSGTNSVGDFSSFYDSLEESKTYNLPDRANLAIVTVSWVEGGKTKKVSVRRDLSDTDRAQCAPGNLCMDWSGISYGGTFPAGTYSGTGRNGSVSGANMQVPTTITSGITRTAVPIVIRAQFNPRLRLRTWTTVTSMTIEPLGSTTPVAMTRAADNLWTYNLPSSRSFNPTGDNAKATATLSDGTTVTETLRFQPLGRTTVEPEIRGVGTTGAALPGTAGTPTGSLRLNPADNNTLSGTVTRRLCTKVNGTLWFNQKFYVDVAGVDLQDWGATAAGDNDIGYSFNAYTPESTLTNRTATHFDSGNFASLLSNVYRFYGAKYVGLVSGSAARGSLTPVHRFALTIPSTTYANSKSFNRGPTHPSFFQSEVEFSIYVTRPYDNKRISANVSIPVYRSTSGTSADCLTGTSAQPKY